MLLDTVHDSIDDVIMDTTSFFAVSTGLRQQGARNVPRPLEKNIRVLCSPSWRQLNPQEYFMHYLADERCKAKKCSG